MRSKKVLEKRKHLTLIICLTMIFSFIANTLYGIESYAQEGADKVVEAARTSTYRYYLEKYKDQNKPEHEITIPASEFIEHDNAHIEVLDNFEGKEDALKWTNEKGWVEWLVDVPEDGLYKMNLSYYPLPGRARPIELSLTINGETPFDGARQLTFNRIWKDGEEIQKDSRGNDIRPKQIEHREWHDSDFIDFQGNNDDSLYFYLEKGENKLRLECISEPFVMEYIKIYNAAEAPKYEEVVKQYEQEAYTKTSGHEIIIEGETPEYKSDAMIIGLYDRSSAATQPYSPSEILINTIGGDNWKYSGQWITWKFDVPEDGLYKIGMRVKQDFLRGLFCTRKVYIDGKLLFDELDNVKFPYKNDWYMKVLGDDDPHLFYLTEGEHEITMQVALGDIAQTLEIVEDAVYELNYLYRKIIMITGTQPDPLRDYYLEREIPDLIEIMERNEAVLTTEAERLESLIGKQGGEGAQLTTVASQLQSFIKDSETITNRLDRFKSNISTLSSWVLDLKEQPVELDYLAILSPDVDFPNPKAGFFKQLKADVQSFICSFDENYAFIGDVHEDGAFLDVWIGTGRDQAQIVKGMIDDTFTPETGIKVNLSLVEAALIEATLAGRGPDVALQIGSEEPVNFAVRGALADLSRFDDFEEVTKRFHPEAMVPFDFLGKYYALPVTQNFSMMFYRKDVFEELGIEAPETWDEFYAVIPIIQKHNMEIGLPTVRADNITASNSSTDVFETLLWQSGGQFYKEGLKETGLDQSEAIKAFDNWLGFYNRYRFPVNYDFYNRFRTGEMPLAIEPYTMFNQLYTAAPEIRGLWDMKPIPGTPKADGNIDRSVASSGTASVMFSKTEDKDAAWEFLKWWTSADVQARYGQELETLMGPAARYNTANLEAFDLLPWGIEQHAEITKQWDSIKGMPQVPGSYYVTRHLANAFRKVNFYWENPRETLFHYNKEINKEIQRKREEFGLN